jgi:hypothetical protein
MNTGGIPASACHSHVPHTKVSATCLRPDAHTNPAAGPVPTLQAYRLHSSRVNVANWCLLLAAALALAGSITWLTTMSTALSATQQTAGFGSGYQHGSSSSSSGKWNVLAPLLQSGMGGSSAALPKPPAITAPPAEAAEAVVGSMRASGAAAAAGAGSVSQADVGQLWAVSSCPPGCVDLGLIAEVLGLPWPCFCQVWLLGDLVEQLHKVSGWADGLKSHAQCTVCLLGLALACMVAREDCQHLGLTWLCVGVAFLCTVPVSLPLPMPTPPCVPLVPCPLAGGGTAVGGCGGRPSAVCSSVLAVWLSGSPGRLC